MEQPQVAVDVVDVGIDQDAGLRSSFLHLQGVLPTWVASNLTAVVSALLDAAGNLCVGSGGEGLVHAALCVSDSRGNDVQAVANVVCETLHLVQRVRCRHWFTRVQDTDDTQDAEGKAHECETAPALLRGGEVRRASNSPGLFLVLLAEVWGSLHRACDKNQPKALQALRHGFTSTVTLGNMFEDLVHLAAVAWEGINPSDCGGVTLSGERWMPPDDASDDVVGCQNGLFQERKSRRADYSPWAPALQLMSWGLVPVLTAENALLACVQTVVTRPKLREGDTRARLAGGHCKTMNTSRDALIAVVTAIAKGYHSLGVGVDLSAVVLGDLLDVAAKSRSRVNVEPKPYRYHSMNLCRLVARLKNL